MPKFSAFSKFGHFAFSRKAPPGQRFYESMVKALGDGANFALDFDDNHQSAKLYANAMAMATARLTLERAGNNRHPLKATEMLPPLEDEYGLKPGPTDTLTDRRAALAVRKMFTRGARREAIENALRLILGDYFVAYHVLSNADATANWADPANSDGTFKLPTTPIKLRTLDTSMSTGLGAPRTIDTTFLGGSSDMLLPGEVITVEPGALGCTESVTITAVSGTTITAVFDLPHPADALITTAPYPHWTSTHRHNIVVVDPTKVTDPELRRKCREFLERSLRGVSTYVIADETTAGVTGPFRISGADVLTNSDFELGAGPPTDWLCDGLGGTTTTVEPGARTGGTGSQVMRVSIPAMNSYGDAYQLAVTIGDTLLVTGWARGDGVNGYPQILSGGIGVVKWTGTTSNAWQYFEFSTVWASDAFVCRVVGILATADYAEFDDLAARSSSITSTGGLIGITPIGTITL